MTPTIGRIVLFQTFRRAHECAAMIAGVTAAGLSLHVFPPGEPSFVVDGVQEWQGSDGDIQHAGYQHRELDRLADEARFLNKDLATPPAAIGPPQSWRWPPRVETAPANAQTERPLDQRQAAQRADLAASPFPPKPEPMSQYEVEVQIRKMESTGADAYRRGEPCPLPATDGSNTPFRNGWLAAAMADDARRQELAQTSDDGATGTAAENHAGQDGPTET